MRTKKIDILLLFPLLAILTLGTISLSSALSSNPSKMKIQMVWLVLGTIVFLFTSYKKIKFWEHISSFLYFANIFLLFLVLIIGRKIGGSCRWIDLGFMNFQVSELTKLATILFLATRLNQKPTLKDGYKIPDLFPEIVFITISMFLIYKEPDLGTSLLIGMLSFIMLTATKINKKQLITLIIIGIISTPLIWTFALKNYQKQRILALVSEIYNPENSKKQDLTTKYHTRQSIIAIGSGRLYGKGYKKGTQNILRFIPEHHTDFIFSVLGEEFGFWGVFLLLTLYFLLFLRMIRIIKFVQDKFSALIILGTMSLIWCQVFVNIGMVSGILPVVGIPLPFFSYGGSSLILNSVLMGLVHNISLSIKYSSK